MTYGWVTVNGDSGGMLKETAVAYFEALSRNFPIGTENNHKKGITVDESTDNLSTESRIR
jgi:hypothetical protein